MIRINRHYLFVAGVIIIFTFYFLNKFHFISNAEQTKGVCVGYDFIYREGRDSSSIPDKFYPIVAYHVDEESYTLRGIEEVMMDKGDVLKVIYKSDDPADAYVFNFIGFWYFGLLYSIMAVMGMIVIAYGALDKNNVLRITLPFVRKNKNVEIEISKKPKL